MSQSIDDQITEYQESQQQATEALSVAQSRVNELHALLQRQTGAVTALQRLKQDQAANSNGDTVDAVDAVL